MSFKSLLKKFLHVCFPPSANAGIVDNGVLADTAAWVTGDVVVTLVDTGLLAVAFVHDGLGMVDLAVAFASVTTARGLIPTKNIVEEW